MLRRLLLIRLFKYLSSAYTVPGTVSQSEEHRHDMVIPVLVVEECHAQAITTQRERVLHAMMSLRENRAI